MWWIWNTTLTGIGNDCRNLGKSGTDGVPNDKIYPEMEYNWLNITLEKIKEILKDEFHVCYNDKHEYTDGEPDQIVLIRK